MHVLASSLSCVPLFVIPWTVAHQDPLPMEFSRQEYWSGLPFPAPGDLPIPGIKPESLASPALAGGFFTNAPPGKAIYIAVAYVNPKLLIYPPSTILSPLVTITLFLKSVSLFLLCK